MSRTASERRAWPILGSAMVAVALLPWLVWRTDDRPATPDRGSVTIRSAPAAPPSPLPDVATMPAPLLRPPAPPPLAGAIIAPPDAFPGTWRAPNGQRLTVTALAKGQYGVAIGDERYDGVLKDGRIHFPRGIDGEWLQATDDPRCLHLGTGTQFCR